MADPATIDSGLREAHYPSKDNLSPVRWFSDISIDDVPTVGGKNASLGEMYRELAGRGVKVPNGFATTANAYRHFLRVTGLDRIIRDVLANLDTQDVEDLRRRGSRIRHEILAGDLPHDLEDAVLGAYHELNAGEEQPVAVAVRSSATAEDLPDASFAGQQETYLNVQGPDSLLHACKRCYASLFTDRAISYRATRGFSHEKIALSIGVQRMVRSDLACSGIMFTLDTESGFRDAVLINASREHRYDSFQLSFTLPEGVEAQNPSAQYKDGVLKIHRPKSEKSKQKTAHIKV